ncbi:MAG: guanylate kinase [Candidatus Caenarcaniphilales bacterium]|nr:guanylate kinase [Candidatus Caenarcaniphilales bacterium]
MVGNLLVLVGPSGVGKGTVLQKVFADIENLVYSISVTTRPIRPGEVEGKNYFFVTKETFKEMIEADALLEYAEFVGHFYGTPRAYVHEQRASGKDVLLEIEVEGAKQIKQKMPEAIFIFMAPPSLEVLQRRLEARSTESPDKIKERLEKARLEITHIDWFQHRIVNEEDDIEGSAQKLKEIILFCRKAPRES